MISYTLYNPYVDALNAYYITKELQIGTPIYIYQPKRKKLKGWQKK